MLETTQRMDMPKALCNDNFVGDLRSFFLEHSVAWLESTIACPLLSGLITYYIEDATDDRHHLMMESVAQSCLSSGVRGNRSSFLNELGADTERYEPAFGRVRRVGLAH